jgi:dolichol-phosphate mannosyltransferase
LLTMDGDQAHDPAEIPILASKLLQGYDLVVGSRYMPGGRCDHTGYRRLLSWTANIAPRWLFQIKISDFTHSYRAFRVAKLAEIDFGKLLVNGYSFFFMTTVQTYRQGFRIAEVPVRYHVRTAGVSKIPPLEILHGIRNLIWLRLTSSRNETGASPLAKFGSCAVCGCEYSKLVPSARTKPTAMFAAEPKSVCLFCGDKC